LSKAAVRPRRGFRNFRKRYANQRCRQPRRNLGRRNTGRRLGVSKEGLSGGHDADPLFVKVGSHTPQHCSVLSSVKIPPGVPRKIILAHRIKAPILQHAVHALAADSGPVQARSQQPGRLSELAYYASGITSVAALSRVVQFSVRFFTYSKPFGSYPDTRSAQASFDPLAFGFQEIWGRRWAWAFTPAQARPQRPAHRLICADSLRLNQFPVSRQRSGGSDGRWTYS
jgi:hypothetical protein